MTYNAAVQAYGDDSSQNSEIINSLPPTIGEPSNLEVTVVHVGGDMLAKWDYTSSGEKDTLQLFRVYHGESATPNWETDTVLMTVSGIDDKYETNFSVDDSGEYYVGVQAVGSGGLVSSPITMSIYVDTDIPDIPDVVIPERVRTVIHMKNDDRTSSIKKRSEQGYGSRHFRARYGKVLRQDYFLRPSRYDGLRVVTLTTNDGQSYRTMETWEQPVVPATADSDERYFYVDNSFAHRSDKIAKSLHGDENLRWWILQSNGLFEDEQLVHGLTLRVIRPPNERPALFFRSPV